MPCPSCEGHGYAVFETGGGNHEPRELQACMECTDGDDDAAAVRFVRALERSDLYALQQLRALIG